MLGEQLEEACKKDKMGKTQTCKSVCFFARRHASVLQVALRVSGGTLQFAQRAVSYYFQPPNGVGSVLFVVVVFFYHLI